MKSLAVLSLLFIVGCERGPAPPATAEAPAPFAMQAGNPQEKEAPAQPEKVDIGAPPVQAFHVFTGGAQEGDAVPIVIAIHGLGDRPEIFWKLFQGFPGRAHFVVPSGGIQWGAGLGWWPIAGPIDKARIAPGLSAAAGRLSRAIRGWQNESPTAGKPIVTGFSQGGMLSFALAVKYPNLIGEAVPVSGFLPPEMVPLLWPAGAAAPKIVVLHGDADPVVPYALAPRSVQSLRALGLDVELRAYPGVVHSVSEEMRKDLFAALEAALARAAKSRSPAGAQRSAAARLDGQ